MGQLLVGGLRITNILRSFMGLCLEQVKKEQVVMTQGMAAINFEEHVQTSRSKTYAVLVGLGDVN